MRVKEFLRKALLFLVIILLGAGVLLGTAGNFVHKSYFFAFCVAAVLAVLSVLCNKKKTCLMPCVERSGLKNMCLFLSVVCLLFNGIWVFVFRPIQAADYQTFFQAAADLANGVHPTGKDYLAMFPHILGYAAFLSMFFRMFGQSVLTAAVVNVVLTTGSGILIYLLTWKYTAEKTPAALMYLLWIVCPSKLLFNAMSLSEPYYTFLLLLFLLITAKTFETRNGSLWNTLLTGPAAGIVLALLNSARPIGVVPMIAFAIWFLLLSDRARMGKMLKSGSLFFLAMVLCYFAAGKVWDAFLGVQLEQKPPSVPGYSVYVGFNPDTQGSYADTDMDLLQSRYFGEYGRDAELAQQSMLESAKERISDNKKSIPSLMIHKLGTLLGHDEAGAYYSKESMDDRAYSLWCVASNIWYYYVCILAVGGCTVVWKQHRGDIFWLVPLCIVGVILAQLLVEVAARYHYCLIPMILLLAAQFLSASSAGKKLQCSGSESTHKGMNSRVHGDDQQNAKNSPQNICN